MRTGEKIFGYCTDLEKFVKGRKEPEADMTGITCKNCVNQKSPPPFRKAGSSLGFGNVSIADF